MRDELDGKVNSVFAGKAVRKDLVRKVKVGANVPAFVLEYLLGKYCASGDEAAIQMGLTVVNRTLSDNYIRPDENMKAQSLVKEKGTYSFIDKVRVRLVDAKYWAEITNFGVANVHIDDAVVHEFDRLLTGGIWAQVDVEFIYDEETRGKYPFRIAKLRPIQLATFNLEDYRRSRREFTTDEWLDLMVRSMGYEPAGMERRLKLLFLMRLVPLCERNFNLIELGPRGTGKSYAMQEFSPYAALLTGPTTVANLFGQQQGRYKGMFQIWDAVGFDEVGDLQKMPKEVITMMKTYCESGQFQRGRDAMTGYASVALFGNTQQAVDVMVKMGHLFAPLPDVIRDDMAFIDRLHFYLPGWEVPKMQNSHFTDHYGFVVDYLAEALKELRKENYTEIIGSEFGLGSHLSARDRKAVQRSVSGLVKILHPHGEVNRDDLEELLRLAIEGRRRVKEQLKKMGAFEYSQTAFSYIENETGDEHFVPVPEQGGRDLLPAEPSAPGTAYAAAVSGDSTVAIFRIEITKASGSGKLKLAGGASGATKESIQRAFSYLSTSKSQFGIGAILDKMDLHVEVIDLLGTRLEAGVGVAFFVAAQSALREAPVQAALLVLGDISVGGNVKPLASLMEPLQIGMENGARRAMVPTENKRQFLEVDAGVLEVVDPIFYGDMQQAVAKALGIG